MINRTLRCISCIISGRLAALPVTFAWLIFRERMAKVRLALRVYGSVHCAELLSSLGSPCSDFWSYSCELENKTQRSKQVTSNVIKVIILIAKKLRVVTSTKVQTSLIFTDCRPVTVRLFKVVQDLHRRLISPAYETTFNKIKHLNR